MMKKHLGMARSATAVSFPGSVHERVSKILQNSSFKSGMQSVMTGNSIATQIFQLKQITQSIAGRPQSDTDSLVSSLVALYYFTAIVKLPLHKPIASCLEQLGSEIGHETVISALLNPLNGGHLDDKEFTEHLKCLTESPQSSVIYKALQEQRQALAEEFCRRLVSILTRLQSLSKNDESYCDLLALSHTATQLLFKLTSSTDSFLLEELYSSLLATLKLNCGMDLVMSVGLCLSVIISLQSRDDPAGFAKQVEALLCDSVELSPLSRSCLLNGVIACKSQQSLELHQLLFTEVQQLQTMKLDTPALVAVVKMLAAWTNALCSNNYHDLVTNHVFSPLFRYTLFLWEHSVETVRQGSREIFTNLLRASRGHEGIRTETLSNIMSHSWSRKGKYGFLMVYIKVHGVSDIMSYYVDSDKRLDRDSIVVQLVHELMEAMSDQQLANYVSDFLCIAMASDKANHTPADGCWTDRWFPTIISSLKSLPQSQAHINQYLLPKITKLWPGAMRDLLSSLTTNCHSVTDLEVSLMLTRRARSAGLLDEGQHHDGVWCGVLQDTVIEKALHHPDKQLRSAVFSLLCDSHKTSSLISRTEFSWVLHFIRDNSHMEDASFRHQLLSDLKHFLYHVLESRAKLQNDLHVSNYQDFLKDLCNIQIGRLKLDGLATHRTLALNILTLISQIFPNNGI